MKLKVSLLWILTSYLLLCKAQLEVQNCLKNPGMSNFNITRISGNWTEIKRYPSFYENKDCVIIQYNAVGGNGDSDDVMHLEGGLYRGSTPKELQNNLENGQAFILFKGYQTETNYANRIASFYIRYDKPLNFANRTFSFVDTDYESYAIVYACKRNVTGMDKSFIWIVSRGTELSPESEKKVNAFLERRGIPDKPLVNVGKKCYAQM